jgi:hypothetical protein
VIFRGFAFRVMSLEKVVGNLNERVFIIRVRGSNPARIFVTSNLMIFFFFFLIPARL